MKEKDKRVKTVSEVESNALTPRLSTLCTRIALSPLLYSVLTSYTAPDSRATQLLCSVLGSRYQLLCSVLISHTVLPAPGTNRFATDVAWYQSVRTDVASGATRFCTR
eukprot:3421748-Rhodomonas_salina.1